MTFLIIAERPDDATLNDPLLDRTFGFDRKQKTVYRLREGVNPVPELSFSAIDPDGGLLASLRFWPVTIGGEPGLLLGPLAVEPALQGRGIGRTLVGHALEEARRLGHRLCLVVGAPSYYRPFGFVNASGAGLILAGPVEPERFQVCELVPGALDGIHGVVRKIGPSTGRPKSPPERLAASP